MPQAVLRQRVAVAARDRRRVAIDGVVDEALGLDVRADILVRLAEVHAERSADIVRLMIEREDLREPLAPGSAVTAAEIVHVIREEMALHLTDIVLRRTAIGAAGHPGAELLAACARIAVGP